MELKQTKNIKRWEPKQETTNKTKTIHIFKKIF